MEEVRIIFGYSDGVYKVCVNQEEPKIFTGKRDCWDYITSVIGDLDFNKTEVYVNNIKL